jgi:hypothetical protein
MSLRENMRRFRTKNLLEQNEPAPIKAIGGEIVAGPNRYKLVADTSLPFGLGDGPVDILGLKQNADGSVTLTYDNDGEPSTSVIDDMNFIKDMESKLTKGEREIDLSPMKSKMPTVIQKVLKTLKLTKV